MTDPRESRFCPGWDAGWHLSRHTSQRDVRLANALPHHHRPHLAWVAFPRRSTFPGRGQTAILYNTLRGRGRRVDSQRSLAAGPVLCAPGTVPGPTPHRDSQTPPDTHFCAHLH